MRKILKVFLAIILKSIGVLTKTRATHLYFIPHPNCEHDKIDIINCSSDNVLMLLNYVLNHSNCIPEYSLYIEIYDKSRLVEYYQYVSELTSMKVFFLTTHVGVFHDFNIKQIFAIIQGYRLFFSSRKIFTSTHHYNFEFKKSSQKIICLNYYNSFKSSYHGKSDLYYEKMRDINRKTFDYSVATSELSGKMLSIDSGISYSNFISLGFPRNDSFANPRNTNIIKKCILDSLPYTPRNIFVYTPTFRKYTLEESSSKEANILSALGYVGCNINKLSEILISNNSVIIVKLHPYQNEIFIKKGLPEGFLLLKPTYDFSLYDLLPMADALITDYTSVYFDFLLLNKPVVFNFGDIDRYLTDTGFSYTPVESVCCGYIAYNYDEFISAIIDIIQNRKKKMCMEKRDIVNRLINKYTDSNSAERVFKEFIC